MKTVSNLVLGALILAACAWGAGAQSQVPGPGTLDKIFQDETHCLVGPEVRGAKDAQISCYCRDAVAMAQYVWKNYLLNGRDTNLTGVELMLETNVANKCGDGFDVLKAERGEWSGPEITRTYPPDSTIEQLKPDASGYRDVQYSVLLTFRNSSGRVTKIDNFIAVDHVPPDFKKYGCPRSAVCPK